jgi:polyhydroxybutyrate depolymerase
MKKYLLFSFIFLYTFSYASITLTLHMNYQNTSRSFLVHFPPGFSNTQHLPLVINMHGSGSDGPQQEFYSRMSETSDSNHFIVCYPNGINNVWNSGFQAPYNSSPDDVGFISKIIDTLSALYNVDLNRVYACGMSNGGFQSYRLACDLENRIAAIASVAGCITDLTALNCVLSRKIPVLDIQGTADPLVNYGGAPGYKSVEETISFFLNRNQCSSVNDTLHYPDLDVNDSSTVERIHYASCGDGTEIMFYKITGGGHTWPNAYYSYIYGPTNRDLDASQEIWNFFNRFTLSGPVAVNDVSEQQISFRVSPNPLSESLEISLSNIDPHGEMRLSLFDVAGRRILEQPLTSNSTLLNLQNCMPGVYILKVEGKDFSLSRKVVKQ